MKRLLILAVATIAACSQPSDKVEKSPKSDFTLSANSGTDMTGAIDKFKKVVEHCPGILKYRSDVESVEYLSQGHADFLVTIVKKPSVIPTASYGMGHTCHFSIDDTKATVGKRPCAWLCTGEDMTGIDGESHSYTKGKLIGPLVRPWANLREAIASTRLDMSDVQGSDVSKGAALLALWAADNMRWPELQEIQTSKYGLVMKDPDSQRGQKLCTVGRVIEIELDRSVPGKKFFLGGMYDDGGHIYRFIALQSTGEIMAHSRARFCGVVTGQQHYANSAGGVAHAVHLVGMFDLPENKTR